MPWLLVSAEQNAGGHRYCPLIFRPSSSPGIFYSDSNQGPAGNSLDVGDLNALAGRRPKFFFLESQTLLQQGMWQLKAEVFKLFLTTGGREFALVNSSSSSAVLYYDFDQAPKSCRLRSVRL
ncbi:hypothetical protein M3Y99_01809000 [Aphelenchoides fujianensis]|nr:hypothetical protein M3Y99_01809000 [Aphelenchoides fujianensis]